MSMIQALLGAKSKYDDTIPFLYEARLPIPGLDDVHDIFHADTICALISYLHEQGLTPDQVEIHEVYQNREALIPKTLYTTPNNGWVFKPEICERFEAEYPGHIAGGGCSFEDREKEGSGPY